MEAIVKYRLVEFYAEYEDPIDMQTKRAVKYASHGQVLSTDESGDDPNAVYGVSESEFSRLESQGVFFTKLEVNAMGAGVTDALSPYESTDSLRGPRGDTMSSIPVAAGEPDHSPASVHGGGGTAHPLTVGEMQPWQIEELLRSEDVTPDDVLETVGNDPILAAKFLTAEQAVNPDPRQELVDGLTKVLGAASGRAPEGSEGVEGTDGQAKPTVETTEPSAGDPADATTSTEGNDTVANPSDLPDDGEGYMTVTPGVPAQYNATAGAVVLADLNGVDLNDVRGTGPGGRVLKSDVEAYVAGR